MFFACSTLGKPKKLNSQLWLRSSENLLETHERPGGGAGVLVSFLCVIIIPTPVWVFDLDFDWGVAIKKKLLRRTVVLVWWTLIEYSDRGLNLRSLTFNFGQD